MWTSSTRLKGSNNDFDEETDNLAKLTKPELISLAKTIGLKVTTKMTKPEIQEILANYQKEG